MPTLHVRIRRAPGDVHYTVTIDQSLRTYRGQSVDGGTGLWHSEVCRLAGALDEEPVEVPFGFSVAGLSLIEAGARIGEVYLGLVGRRGLSVLVTPEA